MTFKTSAFSGGAIIDNRSNLKLPDLRKEMHLAVQKGNIETVKEILSEPGLDIHELDNGVAPLHIAAILGNIEIAKLFINEIWIDVNLLSKNGGPSSTTWHVLRVLFC